MTSVSLYDKIKQNSDKKSAELTELSSLFEKIEKEKTNFSIQLAYDNLFDTMQPGNTRDMNPTPHAYLNLELNKNEKIIDIEDRISLNPTPEVYNSLDHPSHVNLYSELITPLETNSFNNRNSKKMFSTNPRLKKPFVFYESNPINEMSIEPAVFQLTENNKKDNIYEIDKLVQNFESNLNADSFVSKKLNLKKPLNNNTSNVNKRMSSIRMLNGKGNFKFNTKSIREFKNCLVTDIKIGEGEFSETFQGYRYDNLETTKIAAKRLKKLKEKGENIVNLLSGLFKMFRNIF